MNPWTSKAVLAFGAALATGYGLLFIPSYHGYGYAGHGGFNRGPSIFYFGGVSTYPGASVRMGSHTGPGMRGGGLHGGK